ncbi:2-hydroxyacid dehydrogenase [Streptomyces ochraceiscleroticus]|uniref:2-hydroxyacid dehydrogenase n=1 Tax=Streptomyces ochraceiscleroticus TaxID=47761 RepID=A0ABW1MIZ5_9ACTN|nr:2-hydroxyacid dehydrogenase [Streptomyces ochraceiscleroticus]
MNTPGIRIVVADSNLRPLSTEFERQLPVGSTVEWPDPTDPVAVAEAVVKADVLVSGTCTAATAQAAERLRLVHAAGAGTDGIDRSALPPGTQVACTYHHEDSMAEYVAASAVLLRRGLLCQDAALREGRWLSPVYAPEDAGWQPTLAGATVGFVGFGHIGARSWQLLRAFGARGLTVSRRGEVDAGAQGLEWSGTVDDLPHLLDRSDIVVVAVPLTAATRGLLGAPELARLHPESVLINVGRGPVVDEDALYEALHSGRLGGAALDVWYAYPSAPGERQQPSRHPFHTLPNVLMTPHSSGLTRQTFAARAADIAANIRRLAAGEELTNIVERP